MIECRTPDGELVLAAPKDVDLMDVSPNQIWSVTTTLIPFLEHDDANRALMGSNMQAQAVPPWKTEAPLIGTGMETRAAIDTGDVVLSATPARSTGWSTPSASSSRRTTARTSTRWRSTGAGTRARRSTRSRWSTRARGSARARCSRTASTDNGELALGKNCLVAFMSWEGYNFEDAIIISERLVKDDELTSIHIEEARGSTPARRSSATRRSPATSRTLGGVARNLDDRGIVRIGAEVGSGDLLVGKVIEGRDRADGRGEADPRDLQGEGARGPRHLAEGAAR